MTDDLKWEPIPLDDLTRIEDIVSVIEDDGECVLTVYGEIFDSMLVLPPGVRLCRGKPVTWSQEPPDAPGNYHMGYYAGGDWYRCIATVSAGMNVRFSLFTGLFSSPETCPVDQVTYRVRGPVWWVRLPDAPAKPHPPEYAA